MRESTQRCSAYARRVLIGAVRTLFVLAVVLEAIPMNVSAQQAAAPAAKMVVIEAKPGMQQQFEEGYKRHLEWHRRNEDTWTWYGWSVVSGDRMGLFVDGTFGHAFTDFDAPVAPAADWADNVENVVPYATFRSASVIVHLPEASNDQRLERGKPSPILEFLTFRLRPGTQDSFERAIRDLHAAYAATDGPAPYAWYRVVSGGPLPTYILMLPIERPSHYENLRHPLALGNGAASDAKLSSALEAVWATVDEVRSETLRYRADMSYAPEAGSK